MLTALHIENFAIVKELKLDFESGMTAFTGETGAGKSIMIDALMLVLGERADAYVIRKGESKCQITALFSIEPGSEPHAWLAAHDVALDEHEIIIRRSITVEGKSKSTINGELFPLQKVRELGVMLVHIHGQHQHQTLMQHATHREHLDHYAKHTNLQAEVSALYKEVQTIKKSLEDLSKEANQQDKLALLQFQFEELMALELGEGEMQRLSEEHQRLNHAQDYQETSALILDSLKEDDEHNSIQLLNRIVQQLHTLPISEPTIKNALELLSSALIQCEEAGTEIERFARNIAIDPERLAVVEARISELHRVARKHHVAVEELLNHRQTVHDNLKSLQNSETRIAELALDYQTKLKAYEKAARTLTESRKRSSEKLGMEISAIIQQLGMPKGFVKLAISPLAEGQAHGLDKVEYLVCTNPGTALEPLSKIASGGELSRISLAIQMITAERGATPTLLFDEVDVGIGGPTAARVGRLLRSLGERLQIFCVTHQPQVASLAHHHFVVEKTSDKEHTYSSICSLNDDEKIAEIARMLGGLTITEQTRSHAKELLLTKFS